MWSKVLNKGKYQINQLILMFYLQFDSLSNWCDCGIQFHAHLPVFMSALSELILSRYSAV